MKKFISGIILAFILLILSLFILPQSVLAVSYTLDQPTGPFTRGSDFQLTVNIDTQGETLTQTEVFVTYDTSVLQYQSTANGSFFPVLYATDEGTRVRLVANVNSGEAGKTGTGVLAYITFKIIASSPGGTTLCAILTPTPTPTQAPVVPTSTPAPTSPLLPTATPPAVPVPTSPPNPPPVNPPPVTTMPRTGRVENTLLFLTGGITLSTFGFFLKKRIS